MTAGNDPTSPAPLMLSVSGCRGVVGESLTPETLCRFVAAFTDWVRADRPGAQSCPRIVLGRDGRRGGAAVAGVVRHALTLAGCDVIDLGVASTPCVGLMTTRHGADAGLVVTASHNPGQWNGLKPITRDGAAPAPEHAAQIIDRYNRRAGAWAGVGAIGSRNADASGAHAHVAAVLEAIEPVVPVEKIKARRFRVVLDSVNASGAVEGRLLLEALGCELTHLHDEPTGVFPHTPEPTEENLRDLCAHMRGADADAGFAQDPDADRLAVIDERGAYIGEEYTLALACEMMLSAGRGKGACVAANLSTSRMIDDVVARHGAAVVRAPVGEANVVSAMRAHGCVLGGEGNGGVIWPTVGWIRDSLAAMALTLALMADRGKPLSALAASIPAYAIVKRKAPIRDGLAEGAIGALSERFQGQRMDRQDGLRIDIDGESSWLHVRASNTEPVLRLIAEAPDEASATALLDEAASVIAGLR